MVTALYPFFDKSDPPKFGPHCIGSVYVAGIRSGAIYGAGAGAISGGVKFLPPCQTQYWPGACPGTGQRNH